MCFWFLRFAICMQFSMYCAMFEFISQLYSFFYSVSRFFVNTQDKITYQAIKSGLNTHFLEIMRQKCPFLLIYYNTTCQVASIEAIISMSHNIFKCVENLQHFTRFVFYTICEMPRKCLLCYMLYCFLCPAIAL